MHSSILKTTTNAFGHDTADNHAPSMGEIPARLDVENNTVGVEIARLIFQPMASSAVENPRTSVKMELGRH